MPESTRVETQGSRGQKGRPERAAAIKGQTVGDFARAQAIREQTMMRLTARDSYAFVEALLNPPAPNAALRAAAAHYKSVTRR